MKAATTETRAALWVSPLRIATAAAAAMTISALALLVSSSSAQPGILRKDLHPDVAVGGAPSRQSLMRREPAAPAPIAMERPAEWGHLMRREVKDMPPVPAMIPGEAAAAVAAAGRPAEWGHLMRREPKDMPAVPAVTAGAAATAAIAAGRPGEWGQLIRREVKDGMLPAPSAERPSEWGHLMRREAKLVVPQVAADAMKGRRTVGSGAFAAVVFAAVALFGFAQQARASFSVLRQAFSSNDKIKS